MTRLFKTACRYLVVNFFAGISTRLALPFSTAQRLRFGFFPTAPTRIASSPCPSRVGRAAVMMRLPFSHAEVIAEGFYGVKICRRSRDILTAPSALFCNTVAPTRVWLSNLSEVPTGSGTIYLVTPTSANTRKSANKTEIDWWPWSKPAFLLTFLRAKGLWLFGSPSVLGMKTCTALLALFDDLMINHARTIRYFLGLVELKERYCEIAVRRLQQEVLPLNLM